MELVAETPAAWNSEIFAGALFLLVPLENRLRHRHLLERPSNKFFSCRVAKEHGGLSA